MTTMMPSPNLIMVSCVNHQQILFNGLCNLFLDKEKVDCEMQYSGRMIRVHRVLLDVFMSPGCLQLHTVPDLTPAASPDDPDSNSLELLVEFLYRGRVNVRRDQLPGLLNVAKVCKFHMLVGAVQAATKRENKNQETAGSQVNQTGRTACSQQQAPKIDAIKSDVGKLKPPPESKKIVQHLNMSKDVIPAVQAGPTEEAHPVADYRAAGRQSVSSDRNYNKVLSSESDDKDDDPNKNETSSGEESVSLYDDNGQSKDDRSAIGRMVAPVISSAAPVIYSGVHPSWNRELGAYKCSVCPKMFARVCQLTEHHTRIHSTLRPFLCECCAKGFKTAQDLRVHTRSHSKFRPYKCSVCPKTFGQKRTRANHELIHWGTKEHMCDICGQAFLQKAHMTKHRLTHDQDRPRKKFPCDVCDVTCTTKQGLQHHVMFYHTGEKPHVCNICDKGFVAKSSLAAHIKTHDNNRPFVCRICSRPFRLKDLLQRHLRKMHSEENSQPTKHRPFKCNLCYLSFTQKSGLNKHKRLHTGNLPHKCPCGKQFNERNQLKVHRTVHHSGDSLKDCGESHFGKLENDVCP